MKKALIIAGGWDGHQPRIVADIFAKELRKRGVETDVEFSLEVLTDAPRLGTYSLFFPCWTMGTLSDEQGKGLQAAVKAGMGFGGIHGGMGDAFRGNLDYEWMTGGHFVGHPHVGDYTVRIRDFAHPITGSLPECFAYHSEQYYLMVDPGIHILADSEYLYDGRKCTMPVAWIKHWGKGRVFYSALGHDPEELTKYPESLELAMRGILWAANGL